MTVHIVTRGDSSKPPIIFIHGAGGSSATWIMQLRQLSSDFHIVAIDLNGHGMTPDRAEKNTTESYLSDIEEVVKKFDRPVLAGHSMGGMLSQLFALRFPELVRAIILIGTGAKLRVAQFIFDALENNFDTYVEGAANFMFDEHASEELIEASKKEIRKCKPPIIYRDFEACNQFDIMDIVSEISVPTLILVGNQDIMTPVKYSEYLLKNIPNSTLYTFDNAGHSVMLEQAEEFNEKISTWMRTITS